MNDSSDAKINWNQYKFILLIVGVITISLILVSISMWLYAKSGAAYVDLSRPEYQSIREKAKEEKKVKTFANSGALNEKAYKQFYDEYDLRIEEINNSNSFNTQSLSDELLQISDPDAEKVE